VSSDWKQLTAAIVAGKQVALSNKEVLVAAGEIVIGRRASRRKSLCFRSIANTTPFTSASGWRQTRGEVRRLVLTASGGPFRKTPLAEISLRALIPERALAHPNSEDGESNQY